MGNIKFSQKLTALTSVFCIGIMLLSALYNAPYLSAQTQGRDPTPPTFPQCSTKLSSGSGDRDSKTTGTHQVPGRDAIQGRNDVYTLTEGNFVQCTCAGTTGVQVNWWNLQGLPLGRVEIDAYGRAGWIFVSNGSSYGILSNQYLAKVENTTCTASTSARTPTPTRQPTGTVSANSSSCRSLSANPTRGRAPLRVQFTITGFDPNGSIQEYELDTGDNTDGEEVVLKQGTKDVVYTYTDPGTYAVSAWIKDSQGEWKESSSCKRTVVVTDTTGVGGGGDEELPETGVTLNVFIALSTMATAGVLLRKYYRLV